MRNARGKMCSCAVLVSIIKHLMSTILTYTYLSDPSSNLNSPSTFRTSPAFTMQYSSILGLTGFASLALAFPLAADVNTTNCGLSPEWTISNFSTFAALNEQDSSSVSFTLYDDLRGTIQCSKSQVGSGGIDSSVLYPCDDVNFLFEYGYPGNLLLREVVPCE